ncbi:stage II sporulation protein AB (anti-sigma F factor) [Lentibacillus persicus]|uniref:Anti-sigma F factor n=1 Tax=Lentibacillus persicus TaxID=640948 RepID=A0A1I1SYQ8_9BACI|nr:anti-sigma F factor [Lentibacillus persicus]SFD51595.1 stage II sporulation protein AB (anti-sigma F factor) [Lentibacillus persicus]
MKNEMFVEFASVSENESFARVTVASFVAQLDPTMDELTEIKTVVSEAVTNAIIHGYNNEPSHHVSIACVLYEDEVELTIKDKGIGIGNVEEAKQPLYTSKPELERSGMGFTIIENFMDNLDVISSPENGTTVHMTKQLSKKTVSK